VGLAIVFYCPNQIANPALGGCGSGKMATILPAMANFNTSDEEEGRVARAIETVLKPKVIRILG